MTGFVSNKIIITVFQSRFQVLSWWLHVQAIIIWPVRPHSCNPIGNHSKSWHAGLDGLMWAGQEKAIWPYCLHVALLQTLKEKQRWEKKVAFFKELGVSLAELKKKIKKNFSWWIFLCTCVMALLVYHILIRFKFSTFRGPMIKCLLTDFDWVRQENFGLSVMRYISCCVRSIHHDFEPNIFLSSPPTQSIST